MSQTKFYPRTTDQSQKSAKPPLLKATQSKLFIKQKNPQTNQSQQSSSSTYQPHTPPLYHLCQSQKIKSYFCSWLSFILSFIVYLLIWVIAHFSIQRFTDYYYFTQYNVSPYTSIYLWKLSAPVTNVTTQTYFLSSGWYTSDQLKNSDAISLALFFSWIMWKLPLIVFTLKVMRHKGHGLQRYTAYGFFIVLLLLIDIMATAFRPQGYQSWIFFVIYVGLSLVLIVANGLRSRQKLFKNRQRLLKNIKNFLIPILYITLTYICFSLLIPGLYHTIYHNLGTDAAYIIAYLFPAIDLILYSLIIIMTYVCDSHTLKFIKMFQLLNIGYAVGHVVLFSPEDVELYFLVGYLVVRNICFNWIHQRVQKYVVIPCAQPGWLMVYLVSLCINFIPFVGFGKLVVSRSFYSQMLQLTLPIQSYTLPTDYYALKQNSFPQYSTFNPSLKSNIPIGSIFIVWTLTSITQKYHISRFDVKQFFFYIFGIYMFYFGLATGMQFYYLQANSL